MYSTEFIFDGISSKEYDLLICSFEGGQNGGMTAGSNIEFTTFKAPKASQWVRTGASYNEQLTFTFQICKYSCGRRNHEPFSERELSFLMRWLVRKEFKYLQFIQDGYETIFYHCQMNAEKYLIGGKCYGLTLTAACDAPYGWSDILSTTISSSASSSIKLFNSSDEIGEIYPAMEIYSRAGTADSPQNITLYNKMTDTETIIKNCLKNEKIVMSDMKLSSSECEPSSDGKGYIGNHLTLFDDFNWKWFTIGNTFHDRINEITVTGDCEIHLSWRAPRKAVI